ncbi:MAG: inositol monophosphatase family protein [Candidatus Hodgkinia cicadicola]
MMTTTQAFYFKLVNALLDVASKLTVAYNQCKRIECVSKSDTEFNPVTAYDNVIEISIRDALTMLSPNIGIYGEEGGLTNAGADNMWFVDPIDGTKAFASGSPIWGTLLAVSKRGNVVLGAAGYAALNERLIGIGGKTYYRSAHANYKRLFLQCQLDKPLSECVIATSSVAVMTALERSKFNKLADVVRNVVLCYDCYAYALLLKGYVDAVVECRFKPYDFVGLVPILRGAGCCVCDWEGNETCYATKVLVSANLNIQTKVLALIGTL